MQWRRARSARAQRSAREKPRSIAFVTLRDHLVVLADPAAVADAAAARIRDAAIEAIAARGRFTLALTGGSSPLETYGRLASDPFRDAIDWTRVELFWGDERAVGPDRLESNFGAANQRLVSRVAIPPACVHRMKGERVDLDRAAADYAATLRANTDADDAGVPVLDLLLLGIGADAHILSLHPGAPAIHGVDADVIAIIDPPMNPALSRITMTPRVLFAARAVLVFAHTASKAAPLAALLDAPENPSQVPAHLLRHARGHVTILADRAAAGSLSV